MTDKTPHVVVLGAGFGGLTFCRHFRTTSVRVTIVDRTNHHLFQPLLYQVASAGLAAPEIAEPVRSILSDHANVTVLMDEVSDIRLAEKQVVLRGQILHYDYLVLALGGQTNYFGRPEWEAFAPGLKSLRDALHIRSRVLTAFEQAEEAGDPLEQERLMTIAIIGGGATGVELAGAFAELTRRVLEKDFRRIDPRRSKIILIEGGPRVLANLPESLSRSAASQLRNLGVQVRISSPVQNIRADEVELKTGEVIRAGNIVWAAGVSASALTRKLGVEIDRAGRVKANPDLSVPEHPEVFAIGDIALVVGKNGVPVPGVSPAAMQMARHVARTIDCELHGKKSPRAPFRYFDKGTMATIGRSKAVALVGGIRLHGLPAWLAWLLVHLIFLVGLRNKLTVMIQWIYSYFLFKRGARIITEE